MTAYRLPLSYDIPPLSSNKRYHWAAKAKLIRELREEAAWLCMAKRMGSHEHITVGLEYVPAVKRKRDGGENYADTLKALIDGVVDAGVVPDDEAKYVTRLMPVVAEVDPLRAGVYLTVVTP